MPSDPRLRTLATVLIALEYALADFNATASQDDNDKEHNLLDELTCLLAEINRELIEALDAVGPNPVNDPPEHHSEH